MRDDEKSRPMKPHTPGTVHGPDKPFEGAREVCGEEFLAESGETVRCNRAPHDDGFHTHDPFYFRWLNR